MGTSCLCLFGFLAAGLMYPVRGYCILDLNKDLPDSSQALFLRKNQLTNKLDLALPQIHDNGAVFNISNGEAIRVTCPGNKNFLKDTDYSQSHLVCHSEVIYSPKGRSINRNDLTCNTMPQASVYRKERTCANGDGTVFELGFFLNGSHFGMSDGGFFKLAEACHNVEDITTFYVRHRIHGSVISSRITKDHMFKKQFKTGGVDFDQTVAYNRRHQELLISSLLGNTSNRISGRDFLSRGHLAPKADFIFGSHQVATYFYINAAPQWQSINGGNWNIVEGVVRKTSAKLGEDMDVVTGTHGVLRLPTDKGFPREIRLWQDRVPVPELFWKVVRSPRTDSCIVFVGTNNPFATGPPSKLICPDVCRANGWPVRQDQPRAGYIYCCEFAAFKEAVPALPEISCKSTLRGPS